jgi:phosphoribulokinase
VRDLASAQENEEKTMSKKHPIVAVTGSSGAGTTTVKRAFEHIFYRDGIRAAVVEGDSFHRYDRAEMKLEMSRASQEHRNLSHFGPEANRFDLLEELFRNYGESGTGKQRYYIHSDAEADHHNARLGTTLSAGQFTPWEDLPEGTDVLFYEGLHGLVVTEDDNVAQHVDLGVGVVPIINLEWIQKIFRDNAERGYSAEAIVDTIMRRMPDYIRHITPQFSLTDINFQRVATVDTSNPFIARDIPTPDESFVIIRFKNPEKLEIDFPYLLSMIHDSFMSRRNTMVVPGGKMGMAMEVVLQPIIERMMEARKV